eukprot:6336958-Pyramimonas_sp.AAC.1
MSERMKLWIDDLRMSSVGSERQVQVELAPSMARARSTFAEHGLQLASKSVILCSENMIARAVARQLGRLG